MLSYQMSKRGATVYCRNENDRVKIAGRVILYSEANLFVPELD